MPDREVLRSMSSDRARRHVNSKLARLDQSIQDEKNKPARDLENGSDLEDVALLTEKEKHRDGESKGSFASGLFWMIINTLVTIGIVFTNKAIFSDPSLKLAQLTFAAFHFVVTFLTLFLLSRPFLAFFIPRRVPLLDILPLSLAMSLNVILPNLSLAFSTVTFYQIARILLTPTVALLNYALYRATLPPAAILALIPACLGVGMVSYYDSLLAASQISSPSTTPITIITPSTPLPPATTAPHQTTTTPLGILFALLGTLASSLYTVLLAASHRRLRLSSMQLLLNQAPLSAFLLLYAIPLLDTWPPSYWRGLPLTKWALVALSGGFAALINVSQFFIVARSGAVSSTVVGHVKTCAVVALGWVVSGRGVGGEEGWGRLGGVGVAVGGIVAYSVVMLREKEKQTGGQKGR